MWSGTRNNDMTEGFHRKMKLIQRRTCRLLVNQNFDQQIGDRFVTEMPFLGGF
jgi:hypothetical protein